MTAQAYITEAQMDHLSLIPARDMVRALMVAAMPTDEVTIATSTGVTSYIRSLATDLYPYLDEREAGGLESSLINARGTLATGTGVGFINRGGSKYSTDEELKDRQWRWRKDGRQDAIDWIDNLGGFEGYYDSLVLLARNIASNVTPEPAAEPIAAQVAKPQAEVVINDTPPSVDRIDNESLKEDIKAELKDELKAEIKAELGCPGGSVFGVPVASVDAAPSSALLRVAITRTVYSVPAVKPVMAWLVRVVVACRVAS